MDGNTSSESARQEEEERRGVHLSIVPAFKRDAAQARPNSPWDLCHYLVVYDDDRMCPSMADYVPAKATYTACRLNHKRPHYSSGKDDLYDWLKGLQKDYEMITACIAMEVGYPALHLSSIPYTSVGVIDLCLNENSNVSKQVILAYLLAAFEGAIDEAWDKMIDWIGEANDHWEDFSETFRHWIFPYIRDAYKTENEVDMQDGDVFST